MRAIPALIVPFRMVGAIYFVLRPLPLLASLDPIARVECDRRNLLRLWLRMKVLVLCLDLLHLLRIRLLRCGGRINRRLCLAGLGNRRSRAYRCRRCRGSGRLGCCGRGSRRTGGWLLSGRGLLLRLCHSRRVGRRRLLHGRGLGLRRVRRSWPHFGRVRRGLRFRRMRFFFGALLFAW